MIETFRHFQEAIDHVMYIHAVDFKKSDQFKSKQDQENH